MYSGKNFLEEPAFFAANNKLMRQSGLQPGGMKGANQAGKVFARLQGAQAEQERPLVDAVFLPRPL